MCSTTELVQSFAHSRNKKLDLLQPELLLLSLAWFIHRFGPLSCPFALIKLISNYLGLCMSYRLANPPLIFTLNQETQVHCGIVVSLKSMAFFRKKWLKPHCFLTLMLASYLLNFRLHARGTGWQLIKGPCDLLGLYRSQCITNGHDRLYHPLSFQLEVSLNEESKKHSPRFKIADYMTT